MQSLALTAKESGIDEESATNTTATDLKQIGIPLLWFVGTADDKNREAELMFHEAKSKDKKIIVLRGATHGITSVDPKRFLRIRAEITCAFWRERRAGRCKAPRRRRRGDIVEERQRSRCPPAAALPWAAAPRPAGFVARSIHTKGYARRSRLAIGPGSLQQNVQVISARILSTEALRDLLVNEMTKWINERFQ